jgi:hypothetical protein
VQGGDAIDGIDRDALACRSISLFLHRDLTVGVFHARPHPACSGASAWSPGSCWRFRRLARIVGDGETGPGRGRTGGPERAPRH